MEKEATGVLVVGDFTKDLDPQASGSKEQSTHHSGSNPVNQSSHDKAGVFEDIIKVDDMFSPTHELESGTSDPGSTPLSVKGRLKSHVQFWERINTPPFIIECIREGYKIPFYLPPQTAEFKNNSSALKHSDFVQSSILELLSSGRVCRVSKSSLRVVNPLSVSVQSCGKKRLILDLRYVNQHIFKQRVKFEDWRVELDYSEKGGHFTKFDLKSGYHHLDVFPDHQRFLGFSWVMSNGEPSFFMFTVLPFGLSSAPYIFTKLLRPLVKHWRSQGIHTVVYLDDGFDVEPTMSFSEISSNIIRSDLALAGFL